MSAVVRMAKWGGEVRIDRFGLPWAVSADGDPFYVADCCDASAKGLEDCTGCRSCYREIDPSLGGIPEPLPEDDRPEWKASRDKFREWERSMMAKWLEGDVVKAKEMRPEPTTGTNHDSYLAPRSKTPEKDALYLFLVGIGWRFDVTSTTWFQPESFGAAPLFGRLAYDATLSRAWVEPPTDITTMRKPAPILELARDGETWLVA